MVDRPTRLLRGRADPQGASFLELFFDLAFILALAQLSRELLAEPDVSGVLRTALLLGPLWWVWVVTTWTADWYDPRDAEVRVLLIAATLGSLLMGVAIPKALEQRAVLFAGAYVAIHLTRGAISIPALRGHPLQLRAIRVLLWYSSTSILWLTGAFIPAARVPLWLAALVVDFSGPATGWPTPRLGRAQAEELHLVGGHLSERFQQVFIIALGELVLVAGLAYDDAGLGLPQTAAFLLTFAAAVLIGLLYATPAGVHIGPALDRAENPARLGTVSGYLHLIMVAGVIATAVGAELAIAHPGQRGATGAALITLAGSALFLAGRLLLSVAIYRRLSWPRLIGLVILVAVAPMAYHLPLLAVSAINTGVLCAVAVVDHPKVFRPKQG